MLILEGLIDENFQNKLSHFIDDALIYNDIQSARRLLIAIKKILKSNNDPKIKNKLIDYYKANIDKLKFICFFDLDENDISDLMKNSIQMVLGVDGFNLVDKLNDRLKFVEILENRDLLKQQISNCLLLNKNKVTTKKIRIGSILHEPTVSNWLKDYLSNINLSVDPGLRINNYLNNSQNIQLIDSNEKKKIKDLIVFFEHTKKSSLVAGNLEESFIFTDQDGRKIVIDHGLPIKSDVNIEKIIKDIYSKENLLDIGKDSFINSKKRDFYRFNKKIEDLDSFPPNPLLILSNSLNNYSPSSLEYKAIKQEIERLRKNQKNV